MPMSRYRDQAIPKRAADARIFGCPSSFAAAGTMQAAASSSAMARTEPTTGTDQRPTSGSGAANAWLHRTLLGMSARIAASACVCTSQPGGSKVISVVRNASDPSVGAMTTRKSGPCPEADGAGQPGRSSGRFLASLPCRRPVDWPTSMRYPSGSRM
jgi:hypothetical protein